MFKHVELMPNGWLSRYKYTIILSIAIKLIEFIIINTHYDILSINLIDWLADIICTIILFHLLCSFNNLFNTSSQSNINSRILHELKDLHTIPKIYDKIFTVLVALSVVIISTILTYLFKSTVLGIVFSNFVGVCTLFIVAIVVTLVCYNRYLKRVLKA